VKTNPSFESFFLAEEIEPQDSCLIFDLGTGQGEIIEIIITKNKKNRYYFVGIDIIESSLKSARINMPFENVDFLCADIRQVPNLFAPKIADIVVCNPPFFLSNESRKSPNSTRDLARREIMGTFYDFAYAAQHLLKHNGEFLCVSQSQRLVNILSILTQNNLTPVKLRTFHHSVDKEASSFLVKSVKNGKKQLIIASPFISSE